MVVLVLGADGYLGRNAVRAALARGAEVVALVQRVEAPSADGQPAVERREFDPLLSGPDGVRDLLAQYRPQALINAAGATRGDLVHLAAANVALVAALVEGIAADGQGGGGGPAGAAGCRLVHVGSGAEYSAMPYGTSTGTGDPTEPVTPYGVTKLAGTRLVTIAVQRGQIDGSVVRAFNPVGPHAPPVGLAGGAAESIALALAAGRQTLDLGDLSSFRDFVDVRDVADLLVAAALKEGEPPPPVLNAGTGRAASARDLIRTLVAISGWRGTVREVGEGSPASAGVDWQQADISTSVERLGWRPSRTLAESLTDLWASRA